MFGTVVPETAIDKNYDALLGKNKVRSPKNLAVSAPTGNRCLFKNFDQT